MLFCHDRTEKGELVSVLKNFSKFRFPLLSSKLVRSVLTSLSSLALYVREGFDLTLAA